MAENIVSLTEFKSNAAKLIAELNERSHTLVLTQNGRATAIVQDMKTYQQQLDAITLLKVLSLSEAEIKKGKIKLQKQVFSNLRKRLKNDSKK